MCAVSVILDYGRSLPLDNWNQHRWKQFQTLKRQAEDFDVETGQPDCEDPGKAKWEAEVERRLAEIEEKQAKLCTQDGP